MAELTHPLPGQFTRLFNEETTVEREIIEHLQTEVAGLDLPLARAGDQAAAGRARGVAVAAVAGKA